MDAQTIIPDRAEFIDALSLLRRGHMLVRCADSQNTCVLGGSVFYASFPTLSAYGLIDEVDSLRGTSNARYYRLSPRGRDFAERACSQWRQRPLLSRLAVRLTG